MPRRWDICASPSPACSAPRGHVRQEMLHSALFLLLAAFHMDAQEATWRVAFRLSHLNMGLSGSSGIVKYSTMLLTPLTCDAGSIALI